MTDIIRQPSQFHQYEQVRSQMKTGDVIAFSGNAGFSKFIKFFTRSQFSHVAIIVRDNSDAFGDTVTVIESTTELGIPNSDNRKVIKGVQMHFLSQRIAMYDGSVYWVPLTTALSQDGMQKMLTWLRSTYVEEVSYDYVRVLDAGLTDIEREFFQSGFKLETPQSYSQLFCSELVTKALQIAEVLDSSINPVQQTPADVLRFSCLVQPPVELKSDGSQKS